MAESKIYNLDEGVEESFTFQILKHAYRFRHLNSEEMEKFKSFKDKDNKEMQAFMNQFITKIDGASPEFAELSLLMIPPHWKKFLVMLKEEMGLETSLS